MTAIKTEAQKARKRETDHLSYLAHKEHRLATMKVWVQNNRDKVNAKNRKWYAENATQANNKTRQWQVANPERVTANRQSWRRRNPDRARELRRLEYRRNKKEANAQSRRYRLKKRYNLSDADFKELAAAQGLCCALCRLKKVLYVDHCHQLGHVRGLLCNSCNLGLGKLGDTLESLERAVSYLRSSIERENACA